MKPENLGAYYESILDREVRREHGIYYTPPLIVDYMIGEALYAYHNKGLQPLASKNKGINPLADYLRKPGDYTALHSGFCLSGIIPPCLSNSTHFRF